MKKLTGGQIAVLIPTGILITGVGAVGVFGTYTNAAAALHRKGTALGMVAGGEGATLVAALIMIIVTMFGQTTPRIVRAALWLLPGAAAIMGLSIARTGSEMVVFVFTPLGMTAAAEGISFLARRIVVYRTDVDIEAQQRNATTLRQIAYHRARAERHPWKWVRKRSTLKVWRLLNQAGEGDAKLGAELVTVQRERLTEVANDALGELLAGAPARPELPPAQAPVSREPEPNEPEPADFETTVSTALTVTGSGPQPAAADPVQPLPAAASTPVDQQVSREPVLSPAEPALLSPGEPNPEPTPEPELDEQERQILELASRLRRGETLTKNTAAEILAVSPATAGRRLKEARGRINDGTGMYL